METEPKVEVTVTPAATETPAAAPVVVAPSQVPEAVLTQLMDLQQRLTETEQRLEKARMDMVEQYQLEWMRDSIRELRQTVEQLAAQQVEEEEEEEEEAPKEQAEVPVPVVAQQMQQQPPVTESPVTRFLKAIL